MVMLRFLTAVLPVALAREDYGDFPDSGISLLQLSTSMHKGQELSTSMHKGQELSTPMHNSTHNGQEERGPCGAPCPGEFPGPNPIVTQEECRQKANELGFPMGGPPERPGPFVIVDGGRGYAWRTMGCFVFRMCNPGSSDYPLLYHVFYGTPDGNDITPEQASQRVLTIGHQFLDQVTADNKVYVMGTGKLNPHLGEYKSQWDICDTPYPTPGSDEGAAVGDPHLTYAGQQWDVDQSDLHH